ncbi:TPA: hypothetical protein U1250_000213 [Streptococcus suis]|nr:hypothetical protein [Streptococcus suis]NQR45236.1 hypothetical protein [Streptococcus suis]HEM3510886.1 hypothetical protein [Streptococcus suis]HEM3512961.1 hypothetical protein [Streptococcus suis]HEM3525973.1 hypothetical protein [Streptococcus suis]
MDFAKINNVMRTFHFEAQIQQIDLDLPIIFQKRYEFSTLTVKNKVFLLVKEKRPGSLDNFVKQAQAIQKQVDKDVILVFNKLSDEQKKKLLQIGASYIDYQENTFIPQIGFLFSKASEKFEPSNPLSPTEQMLLIALLLHTPDLIIDLVEISLITRLSIPSLYRYLKAFKARGWFHNKQKTYQFAKPKQMIFEEVKSLIKDPIREVLVISDKDFQQLYNEGALKMTYLQALSQFSMLADSENYGSYAISKKRYKRIEKEIQQNIFQGHRLEIWNYEPVPFDYIKNNWFENGDVILVDPISLYLTLKDVEDPRIEEEVEMLEDKIINILGEKNAS